MHITASAAAVLSVSLPVCYIYIYYAIETPERAAKLMHHTVIQGLFTSGHHAQFHARSLSLAETRMKNLRILETNVNIFTAKQIWSPTLLSD